MLTEIFAERYSDVPIWKAFSEAERRLLVQAFRIVSEQIYPYWTHEGKESAGAKIRWKSIHDRLSMELGLQQLSPLYYQSPGSSVWSPWAMVNVCSNVVCAPYNDSAPVDRFVKERLSFIEIAFRDRERELDSQNASLPLQVAKAEALSRDPLANKGFRALALPGNSVDGLLAANKIANQLFRANVEELNERFRRAGVRLNYHNGYIQIAEDPLLEEQVEAPFWALLKDPKWSNVDTDMKEAIDRRDTRGRDPAFYAAKALESTIKIISDEKGWTHGGERGAHSYLDNLASGKNGSFISKWEQSAIKQFFSDVRNELGHGPGNEPMPELTPQQTSWAIEACMSWIKSLVLRL